MIANDRICFGWGLYIKSKVIWNVTLQRAWLLYIHADLAVHKAAHCVSVATNLPCRAVGWHSQTPVWACSGRLIRTPVDNTGVIAYGLWLISTHSLAAERNFRGAEVQEHKIWSHRKILCNKKTLLTNQLHLRDGSKHCGSHVSSLFGT